MLTATPTSSTSPADATNDPSHPNHRDLYEWAGGPIDPDELDLKAIEGRLALPWDERFPDD